MRLLDLFAGIGGFSLAAHWAGWETAAFVERDKFCQKVLRKNFGPDIQIHDDITKFSAGSFRGKVDIVTGGFPCQPFSSAGKRKGRSDDRHLFPEMLRVIRECRPRWVVGENVRGLLSIESGRVYAEVVSSLESEGFEIVTFCIPASSLGAPHRRERLWIVARSLKHPERNGLATGSLARGNGTAAKEQPAGAYTTADTARANRLFIAHPDGERERAGLGEIQSPNGKIPERHDDANPKLEYGYRDVADANQQRLQRGMLDNGRERPKSHDEQFSRCGRDWGEPWIEVATRLCRVDDGIPGRVDRLKCLGNSIVPGIAFEIFRAINETERLERER